MKTFKPFFYFHLFAGAKIVAVCAGGDPHFPKRGDCVKKVEDPPGFCQYIFCQCVVWTSCSQRFDFGGCCSALYSPTISFPSFSTGCGYSVAVVLILVAGCLVHSWIFSRICKVLTSLCQRPNIRRRYSEFDLFYVDN